VHAIRRSDAPSRAAVATTAISGVLVWNAVSRFVRAPLVRSHRHRSHRHRWFAGSEL